MSAQSVFNRVYFSFPVQLVVMLIKKNHLLLIYWAILFAFITDNLAGKYGIPFLFLDPEYLGEVSFWSFFILGTASGAFVMMFNISSYILNAFRFPFIATLSRPFMKYCLNNFIVPAAFVALYLYKLVVFQLDNELSDTIVIIKYILGFCSGFAVITIIIFSYFFSTHKDIYKMYGILTDRNEDLPKKKMTRSTISLNPAHILNKRRRTGKEWYVETYLSNFYKVKLVRGTEHYDKEMIQAVFKQNHFYAAILEVILICTLLTLGFFRDFAYFTIPAAASLLLLFSMFIMLSSAMRFWLRGWSATFIIAVILIFNFLSSFSFLNRQNYAYGINYSYKNPAFFNLFRLKFLSSPSNINSDMQNEIAILEKWKAKATDSTGKKPKLVLVCASGGGLRAALWTFRAMQYIDHVTEGKFMRNTHLISGSSGGAIGAAYFRELYNEALLGKNVNYYEEKYLGNISKDMLNPIAFSIASSDVFFTLPSIEEGGIRYAKDRAYSFEKQLNENTDFVLNKRLKDYVLPEKNADIPILVLSPTIINDGRRLLISSQPVSYLTNGLCESNVTNHALIDGVEFTRFFEKQEAMNLKFTSALRMNATFPYIAPTVTLPSSPAMEVMDAGIRDNLGIKNNIKFLYTFRDWIRENTSGVVILQIRDTRKELPIENSMKHNLFENVLLPVGSIYINIAKTQDYNHDELIQYASSFFGGKVDVINFELPNEKQKLSLSWHLTTREKKFINNAIYLPENQDAIFRLRKIFEE